MFPPYFPMFSMLLIGAFEEAWIPGGGCAGCTASGFRLSGEGESDVDDDVAAAASIDFSATTVATTLFFVVVVAVVVSIFVGSVVADAARPGAATAVAAVAAVFDAEIIIFGCFTGVASTEGPIVPE